MQIYVKITIYHGTKNICDTSKFSDSFGYWYKSLTGLNLGLRSDTSIYSTIMPIWLARILMCAKYNGQIS